MGKYRDYRKMAATCFVGGAIFVATALAVSPELIWLAVIAGVIAGFFGYEWGETLGSLPRAFRVAVEWIRANANDICIDRISVRKVHQDLRDLPVRLKQWVKSPHPFEYFSLLLALADCGLLTVCLVIDHIRLHQSLSTTLQWLPFIPLQAAQVFVFARMFSKDLALWGYKDFHGIKGGAVRLPPGHREAYTWLLAGFLLCLKWVCCDIWVKVFKYLFIFLLLVVVVFIVLTLLIHSTKRVVCTIDVVLGGLLVAYYFQSPELSWSAYWFAILCGGLVAAVISLVHWAAWEWCADQLSRYLPGEGPQWA